MIILEDVLVREIDHQKMWFFNSDQWDTLLIDGEFNGAKLHPISLERLTLWDYPLSNLYPELIFAGSIYPFRNENRFIAYSLINIDGYFQRVELRRIECSNCGSQIVFGNPFASDIYFGMPSGKNAHDRMNRAKELDLIVSCPKCDESTINQPAIWAKLN